MTANGNDEIEEGSDIIDLEDIGKSKRTLTTPSPSVVNKKRKVDKKVGDTEFVESDLLKSWKEILGNPPPKGDNKVNYGLFCHFVSVNNCKHLVINKDL